MTFIVLFSILRGIFFILRCAFLNIRGFPQAITIAISRHDTEDSRDISPFQALTTALSATVGLGNITRVAIAIQVGGAGSDYW